MFMTGICEENEKGIDMLDGYGGGYNTYECHYDGGDCPYPNCKPPNATEADIEAELGNGICNPLYNSAGCFYDDGDCILPDYPDCHVQEIDRIGDGECWGNEYNTEECGYDGGGEFVTMIFHLTRIVF